MDLETRRSIVYLLRLWPDGGQGDLRWRVALISPDDGQRRGFATLDALCAFLQQESDHSSSGDSAGQRPGSSLLCKRPFCERRVDEYPNGVSAKAQRYGVRAFSGVPQYRGSARRGRSANGSTRSLAAAVCPLESHDYDSGLLLRRQTLLAAERWAAKHADLLSESERDFLWECRQSQRLAERERGHSQWLRWALVGVTLLGMALVCLLNQAWTRAREQTKMVQAASSRAAQAEIARSRAESRTLAAYAESALDQDARLAILLSLESARAAQSQDKDAEFPEEASRVLSSALSNVFAKLKEGHPVKN